MAEDEVQDILDALDDIKGDSSVPKNIKSKIDEIISTLKKTDLEMSLRVDKAQQELEEISADANLQPFTRTQLWNIVSLLETIL
jgi:uncharacterized protein (UPF0147 family)